MADLMNYLKRLASGGSNSGDSSQKNSNCFTVSERLQCCIVAFKVMRSNLDALNVDLNDFFVQLYNLILEYRPGRLVAFKLTPNVALDAYCSSACFKDNLYYFKTCLLCC